MRIQFLGRGDPLEEDMAIHPVLLSRESNRQRSLVGYSPQGRRVDKTEVTEYAHMQNDLKFTV